jgi:hypothetical protein
MKKHWKRILLILMVATFVFGSSVVVRFYLQSRVLVSKTITSQIGFLLFVPTNTESITYDKSSVKLDNSLKLVTFYVYVSGIRVTFAEQNAPDSFTDVPQLYDQLLNKLREYQDVSTMFGTVTLTRPVELSGGQSAVADSKGTLIIARPAKDLTEDEWRTVFNNMQLVH